MRWWSFLLVSVCFLTLQAAIAPRLALGGVRPDWLLVVVVFLALHGVRRDAVVAGWILGLCADLMSVERFGLLALSYASAAWFVGSFRDSLFRHHAATQFVVTYLVSLLLQVLWLIYRRSLYSTGVSIVVDLAVVLLLAPAYTAIWAPPIHAVLLALAPHLGLPRPKYSFAGSTQWEGGRV